jgi:lysophospholipase L1-like esterase
MARSVRLTGQTGQRIAGPVVAALTTAGPTPAGAARMRYRRVPRRDGDDDVARWRSFVALGDSFTEGMDDPYPDGTRFRGWADLVAGRLAAEAPDFAYANLAVRGRLFGQVVDEQVPAALAMRPDLVSFAAGGNDALRRGFVPQLLVERFDRTIAGLRATGADVLVFRSADITRRLPGKNLIGPRVRVLNAAVGDVAQRHGARLVDLWADDEFANPRLWSVDRLHLSSAGHRRVAAHVLAALGVGCEPEWLAPAPAHRPSWPAQRVADVRWATAHLAPWLRRRLTGRSSGDTVQPKRPELAPLE